MKRFQSLSTGIICLLIFYLSQASGQSATQKFSLGTPTGPRFTVPPITWPANHGDADVCLWADDKVAASSITIDDNQAGNVPWWLAQGDAFGFRFTWFLITCGINGDNVDTWRLWRQVFAKGHAVQSHSVAHGNQTDFQRVYPGKTYTSDWYDYYYGAVKIINDSIPGNKCITLGYPGLGTNNSIEAMKYHVACRGMNSLQENANQFDFANINPIGLDTVNLNATTTKTGTIFGKNLYRSWSVIIWHYVSATDEATLISWMNVLKRKSDNGLLWVSTFPNVACYNMEYATKKLTKLEATASLIRYALSDSMADSIYTYPLTVKVRLNNDWQTVNATQNNASIPCTLITYNSKRYALIKAIPDRGEIKLAKAGSTGMAPTEIRQMKGAENSVNVMIYDVFGHQLMNRAKSTQSIVSTDVMDRLPTGIDLFKTGNGTKFQKRLIVR